MHVSFKICIKSKHLPTYAAIWCGGKLERTEQNHIIAHLQTPTNIIQRRIETLYVLGEIKANHTRTNYTTTRIWQLFLILTKKLNYKYA